MFKDKQLITKVSYRLDVWSSYSPEDLRRIADDLEKAGAKSLTLRLECSDYYSDKESLVCYDQILETDEQQKERLDKYEIQCKLQKERDRETYEQLRKKFENEDS